jgi:hypothetical protein
VLLSREPPSTSTVNSHPVIPSTSLPLPSPAQPQPVRALHPLLKSLQQAVNTLPHEVPEAVATDALAAFSAAPAVDPDDEEGPFRAIDSALNRVIGFGATSTSLKPLIRRGHFGMDGVFKYLRSCIEDIEIEPCLLEGKIERLVEAMILWYGLIYFLYSNSDAVLISTSIAVRVGRQSLTKHVQMGPT